MSVLLPVGRPSGLEPPSTAPRDEYVHGEGTILLADDEEIVRNFAAAALGNLGYTVITATDGAEAVDIYRRQHEEIDLVILDLIMPILSGAEAMQRMRDIDRTTSFLIASGFAQGNVAAELTKSGAGGFILKPFRIEELSREVARQMDISTRRG
jgi:CheY-like chemotaxis protein